MKRRKILVLIPMLGLFLSGCTFQEGFATAKSWIGEHIYHPVKDWIDEITGKKDEPTPEPKPTPEPGPGPGPSPVEVNYGTAEQPLSLAEFQTNVEKVIDYSSVEEGKTVTHTEAPFYIRAGVKSNEAISDGQIRFTNLIDGTVEVTGYFLSFDDGVDSAKYGVKNAMVGSEVVIKGYGMIFKKIVDEQPTKVFEIGNQSKDGDKGKILSVTPPAPTPGTNYGTAEQPLTTSQAWTLLDGENPSKSPMFVTGTVKSNAAWSTEFNNVDIVITDGVKDFTIFRTDKFPANFAKESITENGLVGATVIATGTGKIYTKNNVSTYELDQGCEVLSLTFPTPTVTSVTLNTYEMALEVGKADGQITATVVGEHNPEQTVTWESSDPTVATVENGTVHALKAGTTNVTAKSTVDTSKVSDPCVVTVTEPDVPVTLDSIEVTTPPTKTSYEEGETLDLTGMVVTGHYSDDTSSPIATGWTSVPAAGATLTMSDTSLVVSYEGKDAAAVPLTITEHVPEKGTAEDPYSVSEAYAIYQTLESGAFSPEVYVEGYIAAAPTPSVNGGRGNFSVTDGVCATDMVAYNINNVGGGSTMTVDDIPVGGKVLIVGAIKNHNGNTFEICWNKDSTTKKCELGKAVETPVITSVGNITGPAEVEINGTVNPAAVSVEVVYSNIVHATVTAATATGDFDTAGEATVNVTIPGWNEALNFQIQVVEDVQPTEKVYKSVSFVVANSSGKTGGYTTDETCTYTQDGFAVNTVACNNNNQSTTWNCIKIGRKNSTTANQDSEPTITTASSIDKAVTKVSVTFGAVINNLPENFVAKLKVSTSSTFAGAAEYTFTPAANSTVDIVVSTPVENAFYQLYFFCPMTGSSNGYIALNALSFSAVY